MSDPASSPAAVAIYIMAVLLLGWLGPLIDHIVGHGLGEGPGQLVWLFLPIGAATLLRWKGGEGFCPT